jgi:2-dehydro-3-deoxygluconokinase
MDVAFVSKLPTHEIGQAAVNSLRKFGVDTTKIVRGGERVGIYYCEKGASQRPSKVIYDRAYSSIAMAKKDDFDWNKIFEGVEWFHFTGITPALSDEVAEICLAACKEAKKRNIYVVYDVNFRPTLLSAEKAGEFLKKFAPFITHLIGNEEHLKMILGIKSEFGEDSRERRLRDIAEQTRTLLGIPDIAVTVRRTLSASDAVTYAAFLSGESFAVSPEYHTHVVDRVGSGDAFSAGLIYGLTKGYSVTDTVGFAAASCAIKHTITNDINFSDPDEIGKLMKNGAPDVRR